MFIRQKRNKSGVVSIQIIDKSSGKYKVAKTIGSSSDPEEVERLLIKAQQELQTLSGQGKINFELAKEEQLLEMFFNGISQVHLAGPELILGKIFNQIGFHKIKDELFRHLVLARLCYPASKLKTAHYLASYKQVEVDADTIYRYLDKLHKKQKDTVEQISYEHSVRVLGANISVVFYDVTTLYFEIEQEDELRKTGFSKEGRHQHPQILLGLLVSLDGYPMAYQIFEGNKFEGHTMMPVLEAFKKRYQLGKIVVVADAGLLSKNNILELEKNDYEYILGARLKNETEVIQKQVLALKLENGQSAELQKDAATRLIVSYTTGRATKDAANRQRGLEKLERSIAKGKLTKDNINNRGYNKYLQLEGQIKISIDYQKYNQDACWDGLKGYLTNTQLSKELVIEEYGQLWKIEKAFRISKTDLRIRPIYHRLRHRIESHICIAFCAYKIYKELERQLKEKQAAWSAEKAIEIANSIFQITLTTPYSKSEQKRLLLPNPEQKLLLDLFEV